MGIFTTTALASNSDNALPTSPDTPLIVTAAWLDGDTIRIDVTDPQTGTRSAIAVPVSDHLHEGENIEFIAIQAIDHNGRLSGVIEIRNPFFNPNLAQNNATASNTNNDTASGSGEADGENGTNSDDSQDDNYSTSAIEPPSTNANLRPLTPDGTGTVIDNVTDRDGGREFFTIFSEDGNEFFLIIDRHRNADNVYLLNAVTEEDLMSLARRSGREIESNNNESVSAIPVPPNTSETSEQDSETSTAQNQESTPNPSPAPTNERPSALSRIGNNLLIFGGIVVVVGGLAYYLKVVRPKQSGFSDGYDDEPDDYDYDDAADEDDDELEDGDED